MDGQKESQKEERNGGSDGPSSSTTNRSASSLSESPSSQAAAAAHPDATSSSGVVSTLKREQQDGVGGALYTPSSPASTSSRGSNDTSSKKKEKDDRSKLRKGKWTLEEEEYTSRIIQYFSTGLLTLPDGATLRSYLAEKLNCDPMRITKKFTGACCLGRRAYHLRDRPRASPTEVEMARLDLQNLENRFRLRVEHEQSGLPLPPQHEVLAAQPSISASLGGLQGSLYPSPHATGVAGTTGGPAMVAAASWLQPSTHPNVQTNPSVAAAAAAGVPSIMNPSMVLNQQQRNQLATNGGGSQGFNMPLSAFAPSVAPLSAATSFHQNIVDQQNSPQLTLGPLQQLILQAAGAQSNAAQPGGGVLERANNENVSMHIINSILASVALTRANNGMNQGPMSSSNSGPVPSMAPSSLPFFQTFTAVSSVPAPSPPASGLSFNGVAPSMISSSPQGQSLSQAMSPQNVSQNVSSKLPVLNPSVASLPAIAGSFKPNGNAASAAAKSNRLDQLKAAYAEQQEALRLAYEKTLKEHEERERKEQQAGASQSSSSSKAAASSKVARGDSNISPAELLQRTYEAHLASLRKAERHPTMGRSSESPSSPSRTNQANDNKSKKKKKKTVSVLGGKSGDGKSKEEEAGVLLGFLNSLRWSYEEEIGNDPVRQQHLAAAAAAAGASGVGNYKAADTVAVSKSESRQKKSSGGGKPINVGTKLEKQNKRVLIASSKKQGLSPSVGSSTRKRQRDQSNSANPSAAVQTMKDAAINAIIQSNQNKVKQVSESSSNNSSSQPSTEQSSSSIEDSDSKSEKTDNTSGEESTEEDDNVGDERMNTIDSSKKGPPRKRLKAMKESNDFTTANLLEHSKRMDRESTNDS